MKTKFIVIFMLLLAAIPLQAKIQRDRATLRHLDDDMYDVVKPGELAGTMALSGFRAVAVDLLWLRTEKLQENQEWDELLALLGMLGQLQPFNEEVWIFTSWNMAFNISLEQKSIEDSWVWIDKGIRELEKGLARNPNAPKLYRQAYYTYFMKVVHSNPDLREYYTKQFIAAYGEHPLLRALRYLDRAIAIEQHRRTLSLKDSLRLSVWYKCLVLNRYFWWLRREASPLPLGDPKRHDYLDRIAPVYQELQDTIEYRNQLDRAETGHEWIDDSFLYWVRDGHEQYRMVLLMEQAWKNRDNPSESNMESLLEARKIYEKIRTATLYETTRYSTPEERPWELDDQLQFIDIWEQQFEQLQK